MDLKLDVSKACNRIEWRFLEKCLLNWVYPVLLNGSRVGYLTPNQGIRQGDPLSPYLFICCVEAFIQMVELAVGQWRLKGIQIAPSAPNISNLFFADNTIVFTRATVQGAEVVRSILNKYAAASGQIINMEKSTMVFSPNINSEQASSRSYRSR